MKYILTYSIKPANLGVWVSINATTESGIPCQLGLSFSIARLAVYTLETIAQSVTTALMSCGCTFEFTNSARDAMAEFWPDSSHILAATRPILGHKEIDRMRDLLASGPLTSEEGDHYLARTGLIDFDAETGQSEASMFATVWFYTPDGSIHPFFDTTEKS